MALLEAAQRVAIRRQVREDLFAGPLHAVPIAEPLLVQRGEAAEEVELLDALLRRSILPAQELGELVEAAFELGDLAERAVQRWIGRPQLERVREQRARLL